MESMVMKKIEVEELKKPLKEKYKNGVKINGIRKLKSKINLTSFLGKTDNAYKKNIGNKNDDLDTTLKSLYRAKYKVTDEST